MSTIEALTRRIGEIGDRLAALPADAFNERITLHEEERELRTELRRAGHELFGEDEAGMVRRRIADIERRIRDVRGTRLSASVGAATGYGGGIDPEYAHALNAALDEAGGVGGLQAELQRLRVRLAELDGPSPR